ncbi:MAG: extracellular solute-binding protein [Eubacteriales bacterium]|nr:extracellular solute-binding protein [Eubacteriales bacterium]
MKRTMTRLGCALLALCLLGSSALAEERPPLRMAGTMEETDYWKKHGIQTETPNYHFMEGLALLRLENAPDLYEAASQYCDVAEMKNADALADLSGSAAIREAVGRMRPEVQAAATQPDGRIIGLPISALTNPVYWRQEAFDAAGLTAEDVPQSYIELLDFAEKWVERIGERPEKTVCFTDTRLFGGNASYNYTHWLLEFLIETWEMQAYEAGETLHFDTPEFIALLERTRSVGKRLRKAEPSSKKREKMMPLFYNQAGGSGREGLYNGGREEGLSHALPFRVTADQPVLMRGGVRMYAVRAGSAYAEDILGQLEEVIRPATGVYSVDLYREGVTPGAHGDDSIERITAGWIKDRGEYAGVISLAPRRTFTLYEGALMKFLQGELSAAKLAAQISVPKTDPNK